jgi:hypothetical protein
MRYFFAIAATFISFNQPHQVSDDHGRWLIARAPDGSAYVELQWPDGSTWKRTMQLSEIDGLDVLARKGETGSFRIDEDAGRFDFSGSFLRGRGTGEFQFYPKRPFVSTLRALPIPDLGVVTDRDLMNLAWGRFSAQAARDFIALGFSPMRKEEMMDLAVQHVTPEFVRRLRAVGVKELDTVDEAVEARMFGVTPDLVRAARQAGITDLTVENLVDIRSRVQKGNRH